jgi:hypothetical protein
VTIGTDARQFTLQITIVGSLDPRTFLSSEDGTSSDV